MEYSRTWANIPQLHIRNTDVNGPVVITGKENLSEIMHQVQKHLLADTRKDSRRSNNRKKKIKAISSSPEIFIPVPQTQHPILPQTLKA